MHLGSVNWGGYLSGRHVFGAEGEQSVHVNDEREQKIRRAKRQGGGCRGTREVEGRKEDQFGAGWEGLGKRRG